MTFDLGPRDLGDGMMLRWATPADIERIVQLVSFVFRSKAEDPPNARIAHWTRDLGSGRHPLSSVDQGVYVEDTRTGAVVASMWLIPTVWTYEGIPFGVGRPEQVASHPHYRRRGLVRALFDAFHARSTAAGELVQGITGIPYYYRQFGYEFALDLGGSRGVVVDDIPPLKEGETETYRLQAAAEDDLPFVMALYERGRLRSAVSTHVPAAYWHWTVSGANRESHEGWRTFLIVSQDGTREGMLLTSAARWRNALGIRAVEVSEGVSLGQVVRPLLRALRDLAPAIPPGRDDKPPNRLDFGLGAAHPLYDVLGQGLAPRYDPPYAWYVRVADVPGFIRHIAPALERRLADSAVAGHSAELTIDFYRGGLRLALENGRITAVEDWERPAWGASRWRAALGWSFCSCSSAAGAWRSCATPTRMSGPATRGRRCSRRTSRRGRRWRSSSASVPRTPWHRSSIGCWEHACRSVEQSTRSPQQTAERGLKPTAMNLTDWQHAIVERLIRCRTSAQQLVRRAHRILAADAGGNDDCVTRHLDLDRGQWAPGGRAGGTPHACAGQLSHPLQD